MWNVVLVKNAETTIRRKLSPSSTCQSLIFGWFLPKTVRQCLLHVFVPFPSLLRFVRPTQHASAHFDIDVLHWHPCNCPLQG